MTPSCGKLMKAYRLNRPRSYDLGLPAVCGRRQGHAGWCLSEEVLQRAVRRTREWREKRVAASGEAG